MSLKTSIIVPSGVEDWRGWVRFVKILEAWTPGNDDTGEWVMVAFVTGKEASSATPSYCYISNVEINVFDFSASSTARSFPGPGANGPELSRAARGAPRVWPHGRPGGGMVWHQPVHAAETMEHRDTGAQHPLARFSKRGKDSTGPQLPKLQDARPDRRKLCPGHVVGAFRRRALGRLVCAYGRG